MFEINAEKVNGKIYVCVPDLIEICHGSMTDKGTPFDFALQSLIGQLKNIEQEAIKDIGENHVSVSKEDLEFIQTFPE
jgi:hypothetical protein